MVEPTHNTVINVGTARSIKRRAGEGSLAQPQQNIRDEEEQEDLYSPFYEPITHIMNTVLGQEHCH